MHVGTDVRNCVCCCSISRLLCQSLAPRVVVDEDGVDDDVDASVLVLMMQSLISRYLSLSLSAPFTLAQLEFALLLDQSGVLICCAVRWNSSSSVMCLCTDLLCSCLPAADA